MSLTQDRGDHVFECDGYYADCRARLPTGTSNFEAAQNMLKRSRWRALKDRSDGSWRHLCPNCRKPML